MPLCFEVKHKRDITSHVLLFWQVSSWLVFVMFDAEPFPTAWALRQVHTPVWGGINNTILRNKVFHHLSYCFCISFAPSRVSLSLLLLACHFILPPDDRSLTLVFSQSGAQSFVHLYSLCFFYPPCNCSPFFFSCIFLQSSFCCLPCYGVRLNPSSSMLSFCSCVSLSLSLSINSRLVGWRC